MSLDDEHYIVKIDIPEKLNGINLYGIMQQAPQVKTLLVKDNSRFYLKPKRLLLYKRMIFLF